MIVPEEMMMILLESWDLLGYLSYYRLHPDRAWPGDQDREQGNLIGIKPI